MYMGQLGRSAGFGFLFSVLHGTEKSPPLCFGFGFGYTLAFLVGFFWDDGLMDNVNSLHFVLGLCDTTLYVIRMHRHQHHLCGN